MQLQGFQKDYISGQGFQIGSKRFQIRAETTNWGKRDYRPGQGFQIGTEQMQTKQFNEVVLLRHKNYNG